MQIEFKFKLELSCFLFCLGTSGRNGEIDEQKMNRGLRANGQ